MRSAISLAVLAALALAAGAAKAQDTAIADRQGSGSGNAPQDVVALERVAPRTSALMGAIGEIPEDAPCPSNWGPIRGLPGAILGCTCSEEQVTGSVWGSGPYTYDSSLCAAARHAGAISATGGPVWITVGPGLEAYAGSTAHDITTLNYGAYGTSGIILSTPGEEGREAEQITACPSRMTGVEGPVTCHCAPSTFGTGGIWGTGLYTHDSSLCTAALHAGFVTEEGGKITAEPQPDAGSYFGSTRNGVTSSDYGSYNGAFRLIPN